MDQWIILSVLAGAFRRSCQCSGANQRRRSTTRTRGSVRRRGTTEHTRQDSLLTIELVFFTKILFQSNKYLKRTVCLKLRWICLNYFNIPEFYSLILFFLFNNELYIDYYYINVYFAIYGMKCILNWIWLSSLFLASYNKNILSSLGNHGVYRTALAQFIRTYRIKIKISAWIIFKVDFLGFYISYQTSKFHNYDSLVGQFDL